MKCVLSPRASWNHALRGITSFHLNIEVRVLFSLKLWCILAPGCRDDRAGGHVCTSGSHQWHLGETYKKNKNETLLMPIWCYYYGDFFGVLARCLKITFPCSPELFNLLKITSCTTLLVFYCPHAEKHTRWQWVTSFFVPAEYSFCWIQRKLH